MFDNVRFIVPPALVYKMGRPGIPRNAVLPVAAPVQAGAAAAAIVLAFDEVPESVNEKTEPSDSVIEKFCPPAMTVAWE